MDAVYIKGLDKEIVTFDCRKKGVFEDLVQEFEYTVKVGG